MQYTYTATGQRETVIDARGTTTWDYDERDRLLSRTDPDGRTISYTYDAASNRTSVTVPSGTITYTFDTLNRLSTVTDPNLGVTRYTYNPVSNLIRTELPNGTVETRDYNSLNRLLFLENTGPGGVINSFRYTLDLVGNRIAVDEHDGRRVEYDYDDLYRLTEETITDSVNGNRTIVYVYDPVGNRRTRTDSVEGLTVYTYDTNDRLLTETLASKVTTYGYDNNGNTVSKISDLDRVFYDWDFENRLISADTNGDGTPDVVYQYDADGIRVSSTVAGEETRYLIDTVQPYQQVIEEYTPGGVIKVSYVHGLDLISQLRDTSRSYYHVDGLGSTRALTNAAGVVTDRYIYDAFGRTIGQVGSTGNVYLFAGEQRDSVTGLDYLRARLLSVGTGRFYGMDPFGGFHQRPLTLHRFLYGNVNPVNVVDPSGRIGSLEIPDPARTWLDHIRRTQSDGTQVDLKAARKEILELSFGRASAISGNEVDVSAIPDPDLATGQPIICPGPLQNLQPFELKMVLWGKGGIKQTTVIKGQLADCLQPYSYGTFVQQVVTDFEANTKVSRNIFGLFKAGSGQYTIRLGNFRHSENFKIDVQKYLHPSP